MKTCLYDLEDEEEKCATEGCTNPVYYNFGLLCYEHQMEEEACEADRKGERQREEKLFGKE